MLNEFLNVINDVKGNISSVKFRKEYFVKQNKEHLWEWFEINIDTFPGYSYKNIIVLLKNEYNEPPKCEICGNNSLVQTYSGTPTFDYCSKECAGKSLTRRNKISTTKKSYSSNKLKEINLKRELTMIEKYGVSFNSQRDDVKLILSEKLLNKDWLYQEYVSNKRSGVDIADELNIYYGTVLEYCRNYGFKIRRSTQESLPQKQIFEFIKENCSDEVIYNDWNIQGNKELDIYIPKLKLAIEHNRLPFHSSNIKSNKNKFRHLEKTNLCESLGIQFEVINGLIKNLLLNQF